MTYNDFIKLFPKEDDAIDWIILRKYKNGYKCPKCGLKKNVYRQNYNRRFLYCNNCKYEFSALKGTIFENTHLVLLVNIIYTRCSACRNNWLRK